MVKWICKPAIFGRKKYKLYEHLQKHWNGEHAGVYKRMNVTVLVVRVFVPSLSYCRVLVDVPFECALSSFNAEHVIKQCHESGRWKGRNENEFTQPHGYTNYLPCMMIDFDVFEVSFRHFCCFFCKCTKISVFPNVKHTRKSSFSVYCQCRKFLTPGCWLTLCSVRFCHFDVYSSCRFEFLLWNGLHVSCVAFIIL